MVSDSHPEPLTASTFGAGQTKVNFNYNQNTIIRAACTGIYRKQAAAIRIQALKLHGVWSTTHTGFKTSKAQ
jgi:hypothetical protein